MNPRKGPSGGRSPKPWYSVSRPESGGYLPVHPRQTRIFDIFASGLLLLLCSPLFLAAAILVRLSGRGPTLFRSRRLGLNKRPFEMLKFRTLAVDAAELLGSSQLTASLAAELGVEHRFGRFLRETRLDELPQLINVLKGDMALIGPRPVRPAVYEHAGKSIPDYDQRFTIAPGLIGYSQLFTPHSTTKRLRSHFDNRYVTLEVSYLSDIRLLALAAVSSVRRAAWLMARSLIAFFRRIRRGRLLERRKRVRIVPAHARVRFPGKAEGEARVGALVDINAQALLVLTDFELPVETLFPLKLEMEIRERGRPRPRLRTVSCHGQVFKSEIRPGDHPKFASVITYTVDTPLNGYRVSKYFLRESFFS